MAWSYRKNARHRNPKKDVVRKVVCNKTKRKTKNEMAGWRVHGPEKDGNKRTERQSKGSRDWEAYCKGGQGPPRAVAPPKKKKKLCQVIIRFGIWKCLDDSGLWSEGEITRGVSFVRKCMKKAMKILRQDIPSQPGYETRRVYPHNAICTLEHLC